MKKFLFTLLALLPFLCRAQNYNCFQYGQQQYFTNNTHYLRCISIDSIQTSATDTAYYPYKTFYPLCSTCTTGSWIGSKVTKKDDGTFLFRTYLNDTVMIRSQALPGDSWTLYNDTSSKYYIASVVSVDTMTFAGIFDSVKRIKINAYIAGTPALSDACDNLEFHLSKDHGFVRIFSVSFFPHIFADVDPFSTPGGKGVFSRIEYHNPTKLEVFQYSPGDVIESTRYYDPNPNSSSYNNIYDSIIAKDSLDTYHTKYTICSWNFAHYEHYYFGSPTYISNNYSIDTIYLIADTALLMPQTLPETRFESAFPLCFHYNPKDTTRCITSAFYSARQYIDFEGCPSGMDFKAGIGQTYYESRAFWGGNLGFCAGTSKFIKGTVKNGISCYNPIKPTNVKNIPDLKDLAISPNPTTGIFTITAPASITSVTIYNLLGQLVFSGEYDKQQVQVDISTLPSGVYLLKTNGIDTRKIIKQ